MFSDWVIDELQHVQLGDMRRNRRLGQLLTSLGARPEASIPASLQDRASVKGAYRFLASKHVDATAIREAHAKRTAERMDAEAVVLVVQDTTELDFSKRSATQGLGPLGRPHGQGLWAHSCLALTAEGTPLGLLDQRVWARDPKESGSRHHRHERMTEDKESFKWLLGQARTLEFAPPEQMLVTIADREADLFDLFAARRRPNAHLLIRARHNRRLEEDTRLLQEAVRNASEAGQITVQIGRSGERAPREARLAIRYGTVRLAVPRHHPDRAGLSPVTVQVVVAEEIDPPDREEPISWWLLTTLCVQSLEDALQCVRWYSYRWKVERFHYVLKVGCRIEELQLETADRIERALAVYSIIAWRILWLTHEARCHPEAPASVALQTKEWQALTCFVRKTAEPPMEPPTLGQAIAWIGRLGGHLGRNNDPPPGTMVLWRGLTRLEDIAAMWHILRTNPPPDVGNA